MIDGVSKNQDALVMADATNTLVLYVLDGHGEHGDAVTQGAVDL